MKTTTKRMTKDTAALDLLCALRSILEMLDIGIPADVLLSTKGGTIDHARKVIAQAERLSL